MIRAAVPGTPIVLVGAVRGLVAEARRVSRELYDLAPDAVGLALSPEEFRGYREYFVDARAEPVVPLASTEWSEIRGLVRFGEVRVPNPTMVEAIGWAVDRNVPVEPLDPRDDATAEWFTEHIGYVELVRRTLRERGLAHHPPEPASPDEFVAAWEDTIDVGAGSRRYRAAKDAHLVRAATDFARGRSRVALVLDRERLERVHRALATGAPGA